MLDESLCITCLFCSSYFLFYYSICMCVSGVLLSWCRHFWFRAENFVIRTCSITDGQFSFEKPFVGRRPFHTILFSLIFQFSYTLATFNRFLHSLSFILFALPFLIPLEHETQWKTIFFLQLKTRLPFDIMAKQTAEYMKINTTTLVCSFAITWSLRIGR